MIPHAPRVPQHIITLLQQLRQSLTEAGLILQIPAVKANAWDRVIEEWAAREDLELIIRRSNHPDMCMRVQHETGRNLVPSDNSPAQWMVMQCFDDNIAPSIDYISQHIHEIPMTMRMSRAEAESCNFPARLDDLPHAGLAGEGWYLAHIQGVGLGRVGPIENVDISVLQEHFLKLMKPSNMFLIQKKIWGLAEIDTFLE